MASNVTSVEEESEGLTTCCICMEVYNEGERKPKFLSCHHTYCLKCIKEMARRSATQGRVCCPKCNADCVLPVQGPELLSTNGYVLNNIKLKNLLNNQHYWCLECKATPTATCEGQHSIIDRMEDVEDIQVLQMEVTTTYGTAIEKRQQICDHLLTVSINNDKVLQKLRSLAKKKQLTANKTGSGPIKKKLKQDLQQAKKEVDEANKLWSDLISTKALFEPVVEEDGRDSRAKKRKLIDVDGGPSSSSNFYNFSSITEISASRVSSSKPFHSRDLIGEHGDETEVGSVEFSDDGSFFVSGGADGRVLLWSTDSALSPKCNPKATAMDARHNPGGDILGLSISPDNNRIFSGADDDKLFVHDAKTTKLLSTFDHPSPVYSVALQPGSNGNVCATACQDGIIRLFDTRRNQTGAFLQTGETQTRLLFSTMFSPAEPSIVAVASKAGVNFFDIRNIKSRIVYSFPSKNGTQYARFNRSGSRLLCYETNHQLVVYDLPTIHQSICTGKVSLKAPDFDITNVGSKEALCFAGIDDEFIIAASLSDNDDLSIWSLPEAKGHQDLTVNQPLRVLTGHDYEITCVRYSREKTTLISCDTDGLIRLWTP